MALRVYREVIQALSKNHRVIVPDYMGFGKSETPQDREYTTKTHADSIEALVEKLDLNNLMLLVHDWGGQMGVCEQISREPNMQYHACDRDVVRVSTPPGRTQGTLHAALSGRLEARQSTADFWLL